MNCKAICIVLVGVIAYFCLMVSDLLDISKTNVYHGDQLCTKVKIEKATEDLVQFGNLLIGATGDSISMYYKHLSAASVAAGTLISIDPITHKVSPIQILNFPGKFHMNPHGISLFQNKTLYVLSHSYSKGGEIIFLFDLSENSEKLQATYVKSIKISEEHGIYNGITILNENYFYITQWMPFPDTEQGRDVSILTTIYRFFLFSFTQTNGIKLCRVDEEQTNCEYKARGYMPNGITHNEGLLFVADSIEKAVNVYEIGQNYDLTKVDGVKIAHCVDNLHFDNGKVYATGINKLVDYVKFSNTVKKNLELHLVPGGTSQISFKQGKWVSDEIIMQELLSFPSSSIVHQGQIIISSVISDALLFCNQN